MPPTFSPQKLSRKPLLSENSNGRLWSNTLLTETLPANGGRNAPVSASVGTLIATVAVVGPRAACSCAVPGPTPTTLPARTTATIESLDDQEMLSLGKAIPFTLVVKAMALPTGTVLVVAAGESEQASVAAAIRIAGRRRL